MAESVVTVAEVKALKTQSGNTRFVLRDDDGREYTTFREQIARDAVAAEGRKARIWILVGDGQSYEDILARAVERGATELWRDHYWKEFNGYNHAFQDPWGNEIVLWGKAGPDPQVPANYTRE